MHALRQTTLVEKDLLEQTRTGIAIYIGITLIINSDGECAMVRPLRTVDPECCTVERERGDTSGYV